MKKLFLWILLSFSLFIKADEGAVFDQTFRSILKGETELVSTYLTAGLDIHASDKHGNTLLHAGVMVENSLIVRILLEYQADPHKKNNFGSTPLSLAEELGSGSILEMLTLSVKSDSNQIPHDRRKKMELPDLEEIKEEKQIEESFWRAVEKEGPRRVSTLLTAGADKYIHKTRRDIHVYSSVETPLLLAIQRRGRAGDDSVRKLMAYDNKFEDFETYEEGSETDQELRYADEIVDILIQYSDVNFIPEKNHLALPINLAIHYGLPDTVEKLAKAGADLSPALFHIMAHPLSVAIKREHFEIIAILLKYKAPFTHAINNLFKEKPKHLKALLFIRQHVGSPIHLGEQREKKHNPNNMSGQNAVRSRVNELCRRIFSKPS